MIRKLILETTMRCDLKCAHCVQGYPQQRLDFPLDILPRLLEEARPFGARHVVLTGGEPHLHPDFDQLVKIIHEANYHWSFISHGGRAEPYARLMQRYRESCTHALLSLDGATAEVHDAIRKREGAFARVIASAQLYRRMGFKVRFQASINQKNMHQLEDIARLAQELGADALSVAGTIPTPWNADLQLSDEERLMIYQRACRLREEIEIEIRHTSALYTEGGVSFCPVLGFDSMTFNPRGEMIVCCDIQSYGGSAIVGSAGEHSLAELVTKWLDIVNELKQRRVKLIAAGQTDMIGFDTCAFCNHYFSRET